MSPRPTLPDGRPIKQPCGATTERHGHTFTCVMWADHADHIGGSPGVRGLVKWPNPSGTRPAG